MRRLSVCSRPSTICTVWAVRRVTRRSGTGIVRRSRTVWRRPTAIWRRPNAIWRRPNAISAPANIIRGAAWHWCRHETGRPNVGIGDKCRTSISCVFLVRVSLETWCVPRRSNIENICTGLLTRVGHKRHVLSTSTPVSYIVFVLETGEHTAVRVAFHGNASLYCRRACSLVYCAKASAWIRTTSAWLARCASICAQTPSPVAIVLYDVCSAAQPIGSAKGTSLWYRCALPHTSKCCLLLCIVCAKIDAGGNVVICRSQA